MTVQGLDRPAISSRQTSNKRRLAVVDAALLAAAAIVVAGAFYSSMGSTFGQEGLTTVKSTEATAVPASA